MNAFEGVYGVNTIDLGMENLDVREFELNHVNVQQCSIIHGVPMMKHGGMIHGLMQLQVLVKLFQLLLLIMIYVCSRFHNTY